MIYHFVPIKHSDIAINIYIMIFIIYVNYMNYISPWYPPWDQTRKPWIYAKLASDWVIESLTGAECWAKRVAKNSDSTSWDVGALRHVIVAFV